MAASDTLKHQMLTMLALAGNFFLWNLILPSREWILGATLLVSGLLYLALPYDLIPDSVPLIGRLDNYIAIAVSALGVYYMKVAHAVLPMSPTLMKFLQLAITYNEVNYVNVSCVVVLLAFLAVKQIRYAMIGLLAMASIPCAFLSLSMSLPWAVGASLLVIGITYVMLPIDLIPDWIPLIGELDDTIIGGGGIVVGVVILALAYYMQVPVYSIAPGEAIQMLGNCSRLLQATSGLPEAIQILGNCSSLF